MHVIFVEPRFPVNQSRFVEVLRRTGAAVSGVGESPPEALGSELRGMLACYEQVGSVCHEPSLLQAVKNIQAKGWVDRLEATVEAHILPVAKVREACGIPGTTVRTAFLCRDKPAMKDALREADVPTAQSIGSGDPAEIKQFAENIGFPLIVKPRGAAGAAGTYRVDDLAELVKVLDDCHVGKGAEVAVEEFVEGHEGFYDTLCVGGNVVHEFISHYYPNVLHAMRSRWISPQIVITNRLDAPGYDEVKALGKKVIDTLGIGTSATHMEWFYGPKGLKFSEIGCRPPGVSVWDLYSVANDIDTYQEWANTIVFGEARQKRSLRYSAGMINLRPDRDGRIVGYEGLDEILERFGDCIIDKHLPPPGSPTAPIDGGYKVNAWMRLRHPDYDELRAIMTAIGETVRVRAAE
jgi:formate-dependent phosphoribosylglycinamide formyltransferase (GAR transformylase)